MSFKRKIEKISESFAKGNVQLSNNNDFQTFPTVVDNSKALCVLYNNVPIAITSIDEQKGITVACLSDTELFTDNRYADYWGSTSEKINSRLEMLEEEFSLKNQKGLTSSEKYAQYIRAALENNTYDNNIENYENNPDKKIIYATARSPAGEQKVVVAGAEKYNDEWLVSVSKNYNYVYHPIESDYSKIIDNQKVLNSVFDNIDFDKTTPLPILLPEDQDKFRNILISDFTNATQNKPSLFFDDLKVENNKVISPKIGEVGTIDENNKISINSNVLQKIEDWTQSTSFENYLLAEKNYETIKEITENSQREEKNITTPVRETTTTQNQQVSTADIKKVVSGLLSELQKNAFPSQEITDKALMLFVAELRNTAYGQPSSDLFSHFSFENNNIISSTNKVCGTMENGNITLTNETVAVFKDFINSFDNEELSSLISMAPDIFEKGVQIDEIYNSNEHKENFAQNFSPPNFDDEPDL